MTTYQFRNSTRVRGITAQTAGEELARIQQHHGDLTAALVVHEARPNDALLHPAFEWDDATAAELHREHQARNLIRSVQIINEDDDSLEPCYVHVSSLGAYVPAETVVQSVDLFEQAWRDAAERIAQAEHSLAQLVRLAERCDAPTIKQVQQAEHYLSNAKASIQRL